ncbi:10898_t:CDS:2, partial [Racocetra persica]
WVTDSVLVGNWMTDSVLVENWVTDSVLARQVPNAIPNKHFIRTHG